MLRILFIPSHMPSCNLHYLSRLTLVSVIIEEYVFGGLFAVKFPRALTVEALFFLVADQLKSVCLHLELGAIVQPVIIQIDAVRADGSGNIVEQVDVALSLIHCGLFLQFFIFALSLSFTFSLSLCLFSIQFRSALIDLNCILGFNCDITWTVVIILLKPRLVLL